MINIFSLFEIAPLAQCIESLRQIDKLDLNTLSARIVIAHRFYSTKVFENIEMNHLRSIFLKKLNENGHIGYSQEAEKILQRISPELMFNNNKQEDTSDPTIENYEQ